ncbi:MAG: YitT family protein [Oscillibacter sp.]|nr:YitT family protein [Oscillibacter sp.]
MLYSTHHNRTLRLLLAVLGTGITACAQNLFIVPLHLYTGGLMGVCQLIRTLVQEHLAPGTADIAGILYFLANIPILLLALRDLGRPLVVKTIICTVTYSVFYSLIPAPAVPIVEDYLTGCLLGGILNGIGSGLVLTCGCSTGGLDIAGLILSKRGSGFTVGRFSISFNAVLYAVCLVLFTPEIAIYSIIYNFTCALVLDRVHQQNISMQALIFTRADQHALGRRIIEKLGRGVTYWEGMGAYTEEGIHVLCVCLSKYEVEELLHTVHEADPHAFLTTQQGVHVYGNFRRKLD